MEEQIEYPWLKDADFNQFGKLTAVVHSLVKSQKSKELVFILENGAYRQLTVFGDNWNAFVNVQRDSDLWPGIEFELSTKKDSAGKNVRTVRIVRSK
jgi:hypothetical protein